MGQERMAAKTAYLKSLAVDIETESKDSHRLLGGLGDDMDGSSGLMGGSLSRVTALLGSGRSNRQVMCYVVRGGGSLHIDLLLCLSFLIWSFCDMEVICYKMNC